MKTIYLICLSFLFISISNAQDQDPLFDQALADSLGADDYGMKSYMLVILKTGEAKIEDKNLRDSLFKSHFSNMTRLADEGKLLVAGPIGKNERSFRGIFILNTTEKEVAQEWVQGDLSIANGIFDVEFYPWYGSAALGTYTENHKRIQKVKF